jgi:hypothetical protein
MIIRDPRPRPGEALFRLLTRQKSAKARLPIFRFTGGEAIACFPAAHQGGQLLTFSAANC